MATIADTLYTIQADVEALDVTMTFSLVDGPYATSSGITSRQRYALNTDASDGTFSIDLREGVFLVQWRIDGEWSRCYIGVPDDTNTYTFSDIATSAGTTISGGGVRYFATIAAFEAQASAVPLVFLSADLDGNTGWFEKSSSSVTGMTTGIDYITDSDGNNYLRRRD